MKNAEMILHGKLTFTNSELIDKNPDLEEEILQAMVGYAELVKNHGISYVRQEQKQPIKQMKL